MKVLKENTLFGILLAVFAMLLLQNFLAPLIRSGDPDPIGSSIARGEEGEPKVLSPNEYFYTTFGGWKVKALPFSFHLNSTCVELDLDEDAQVVKAATEEDSVKIKIKVGEEGDNTVTACSPYDTTVILWAEK